MMRCVYVCVRATRLWSGAAMMIILPAACSVSLSEMKRLMMSRRYFPASGG